MDYKIDADRFFDVMGVLETKQVKMVAITLNSVASMWWNKLVIQSKGTHYNMVVDETIDVTGEL